MEIWKKVKNYEGIYQVSNCGNIKSIKFKKEVFLKPSVDSRGYYKVDLFLNGIRKTRNIHQLVAESFLGYIPDGTQNIVVNHINHNKLDNKVKNLELITQRENANLKHIKSSSEYVGVSRYKPLNKWRARINIKGKDKYLGYFINEYDAHLAYQLELSKL